MHIFINAVSAQWYICLFDNTRSVIAEKYIHVKWNESSKLIDILHEFFQKQKVSYSDIENLIVVNGPGSFTGLRTISLIVNTIAFTNRCFLTELSYFELFTSYPIIKTSSKRDVFIKKTSESDIEILPNQELENYLQNSHIKKVHWEHNVWENDNIVLMGTIDYNSIIQSIELENKKLIRPLYIKKPNIQ